jgi:hypothetical protein
VLPPVTVLPPSPRSQPDGPGSEIDTELAAICESGVEDPPEPLGGAPNTETQSPAATSESEASAVSVIAVAEVSSTVV